MKKHVEKKHATAKHLQKVHLLPPLTQTENLRRKLPQESAFGGTVQTYFLEANGDHDFLQLMVDRKKLLLRL